MKKTVILIVLSLCVATGCKKKTTVPPPTASVSTTTTVCPYSPNLVDKLWKPVLTGYIDISFGSNGNYYEDTVCTQGIQGTWRTGCPGDSIVIQKQFYKVQYRVVSVTADTLKLINPVNFVNVYHK